MAPPPQVRLGNFDRAESMLLKSYEIIANTLPANQIQMNETIDAMIELYQAWEKPERIKELQARPKN